MDKEVVKKNSAGSLATINLRGDAGKGAEEIKSDDVSNSDLKNFFINFHLNAMREIQNMLKVLNLAIYAAGFTQLIDGNEGLNVVIAHSQTRYPEWQERGDSASAPVGTHLEIPARMLWKRRTVGIDCLTETM